MEPCPCLISFEVGGGLLRHVDEADSVATLAFLPPRRARMILGAPKLRMMRRIWRNFALSRAAADEPPIRVARARRGSTEPCHGWHKAGTTVS